MKIAYVFSSGWPSNEAGISFTSYTCWGLAKADEKNQIFFVVAKNTEKQPEKMMQDYFSVTKPNNLTIDLIDNKSLLPDSVKFYLKAYARLKQLIKEDNLDAIITRTVSFLPFLLRLKNKFGVKVFFEAHNFYLKEELKASKPKRKRSFFQKKFLPQVDGIIAHQTELIKQYQQEIPKQRYCLARTGIREITKADDLWEREYLGYIGSIDGRKRVADILKALTKIEDENLKLLIIGGKTENRINKFLDLAEQLGIKDRVKITGWVDRSEVEKYLRQIKIGLVPLEDTFFNRYLTSPMKIFNYFSHGLPVIGSDLPPVREIVTDDCGLFYNNQQELVAAINKLNSKQKLYQEFSQNVFTRAEDLLWEKRGARLLEFIKQT